MGNSSSSEPQIVDGKTKIDEIANENDQEIDSGNNASHVVGGRTEIDEVASLVGVSEHENGSNDATLPRGRARQPEDKPEGRGTDFQAQDVPLRRSSNNDDDGDLPQRVPPDDDDDNAHDLDLDVASVDMDFQTTFLVGEDTNSPQDDVLSERRGRDARASGDDTIGTFMPQAFSASEEELQEVGEVQHPPPQELHGDRRRTRGRENEQIIRKKRLRRLKSRAGNQVSLAHRRTET